MKPYVLFDPLPLFPSKRQEEQLDLSIVFHQLLSHRKGHCMGYRHIKSHACAFTLHTTRTHKNMKDVKVREYDCFFNVIFFLP